MGDGLASYLDLVKACDNFPNKSDVGREYYELHLPHDGEPHGYLLPATVQQMPWTAHFKVRHSHPRTVTVLDSSNSRDTANTVNAAFAELVTICIEQDLFHVLDRRHSEPFAILGAKYPICIERFASSLFGITACGAHLVAYVNTKAGLKIWVARRASHLYSYPGYLDSTVAGGVTAGDGPLEVIIKEAAEEASFSSDFVRPRIRSCGVLTCMGVTGNDWPGEKGLVLPDVLYTYDLELPESLSPKPHDEEVSGFQLLSDSEVKQNLQSRQFKPDAAIVLIDFLIRHGTLTAANEEDYAEITMRLHRKLPFPVKRRTD